MPGRAAIRLFKVSALLVPKDHPVIGSEHQPNFCPTIVNSPEIVKRRSQPKNLWIDIATESSEAPTPGMTMAGMSEVQDYRS